MNKFVVIFLLGLIVAAVTFITIFVGLLPGFCGIFAIALYAISIVHVLKE